MILPERREAPRRRPIAPPPLDSPRAGDVRLALVPQENGTVPTDTLRFVDVVAELHRIADMATTGTVNGHDVVAACRRAESLLSRLRNQFLDEVVLGEEWPGPRSADPISLHLSSPS